MIRDKRRVAVNSLTLRSNAVSATDIFTLERGVTAGRDDLLSTIRAGARGRARSFAIDAKLRSGWSALFSFSSRALTSTRPAARRVQG